MAYSSIPAARIGHLVGEDPDKKAMRACRRCGHVREARKSSHLCKDCRDSLTTPEKRLWAA